MEVFVMRRLSALIVLILVVLVAESCGDDASESDAVSVVAEAAATTAGSVETTTTASTTTTTTSATTVTETGSEEVLEALLEDIPELEWDGAEDMEEIDEGGVHLWGTSDRQLAPGTSRAVELSVAYGIALEANGWTLLDPEPQCTLPAGTIIDKSGQVVGDPFECGFEAENDDGRYLSIYAGGEPMLQVDLCIWPSAPLLDTCPRTQSE